jgi:cell division protein ZapA (FtsZ GTPase activity inhibitor)
MELNDTKQQKIHVKIGNFRIPMNVLDEQEEEIFRKAEKQVNTYIAEYNKNYPNMSDEEIIALAAFRLASVIFKMEMHQDIDPLAIRIESLDKELTELLDIK